MKTRTNLYQFIKNKTCPIKNVIRLDDNSKEKVILIFKKLQIKWCNLNEIKNRAYSMWHNLHFLAGRFRIVPLEKKISTYMIFISILEHWPKFLRGSLEFELIKNYFINNNLKIWEDFNPQSLLWWWTLRPVGYMSFFFLYFFIFMFSVKKLYFFGSSWEDSKI